MGTSVSLLQRVNDRLDSTKFRKSIESSGFLLKIVHRMYCELDTAKPSARFKVTTYFEDTVGSTEAIEYVKIEGILVSAKARS